MKSSTSISRSTIRDPRLDYRMPAEWEPHEATWLTWPRREGASFPGRYEVVRECWIAMCRALSPGEKVRINVMDETHEAIVRAELQQAGLAVDRDIFLHRFPAWEPWCRDHGPTFLVRRGGGHGDPLAVVDWIFNAWGGKYRPFDLDDAIPKRIAEWTGARLFEPGIVLEGGSIDVNGCGTLLTTESCLLNPNRNPHLSRAEIEETLREQLGVSNILWLGSGLVGDDTDGHVDDLARFVDPRTVVTVVEEDPSDVNYAALRENHERLRGMKDQDGNPLRVVALPTPGVVEHRGQRLPASYANFYLANGVALLPAYHHPNDAVAREILQRLLPGREIVPVDCRKLIRGRGAIHCVTQQQPRGDAVL